MNERQIEEEEGKKHTQRKRTIWALKQAKNISTQKIDQPFMVLVLCVFVCELFALYGS